IDRHRVTQSKEQKSSRPDQPSRPIKNSERNQEEQKSAGDLLVELSEQRVSYVASVELTYRKQVECGCEKSEPRGETDWMKVEIHSGRRCLAEQELAEFENERFTESESLLGRIRRGET